MWKLEFWKLELNLKIRILKNYLKNEFWKKINKWNNNNKENVMIK